MVPLVNIEKTMENSPFLIGKSTIYKWPFSIVMLVYQRVYVIIVYYCILLYIIVMTISEYL